MKFNFFNKKPKSEPVPDPPKKISIMYSYEWKEDVPLDQRDTEGHRSRPFCKKLMDLNRIYSRADIENISQRLGYSVFDRCGGDDCRHVWKSNIVVK
jgi:hypothetical protein